MRRGLFAIGLLAVMFVACSNSEMATPESASGYGSPVLAEMIRVKAVGAEVSLGTNSSGARASERPEMRVKFGYDYSMSRSEVTCGEFNRLMKPATGLSLDCDNDALPATNVTFYDAVLFANERSREEGVDTAYIYSGATFDRDNHCTNLEGFVFVPESESYRLPTEAEWVLVASRNWAMDKAWTADNSEYRAQPVCSWAGEGEFCDMAGNAMEWVNDWSGTLKDTTLSDYVGAPDGGALGQRIVKGGSFRNKASSIMLYSRGDVYTVVSSTRAEYVGFRLAFGAIPSATWMGDNGKAATNRIVPLASFASLYSRTGSYKVKLAFRNDATGNLAYVNYSSGIASVVEIADTLEVYHPEISPDGERVAFCTRIEGVSGKSLLYVRDLDADGSNLVKLDVESAAIPRWRVLESGDTVIVYVTDAGNNKDEAAFKKASTWQVKFSGGKFGSPEKLFDGAYHDGISEDNTLAVSGARLLRARMAKSGSTVLGDARDTVWYDSAQACNASLAKDGSKRTLFLDFGKGPGLTFVGEKYDTHERLLVADSSGKLIQSVAAPAGYTFDHSEWAFGKDNLAVATLANLDGAHQKIVLVGLSDSSVLDLVKGDELWHPSLWIKGSGTSDGNLLNLDSAGMYFEYNPENQFQSSSVELAMKLQAFWAQRKDVECVVLGSSMLMDAVVDTAINSFKTLNMGITLSDQYLIKYLTENYVLPYAEKIKVVVVELAPGLLYRYESEHFDIVRRFSPGLVFDEHYLNQENADLVASLSQKYSYPRNLFSQLYMDDALLLPSVAWGDAYVNGDISKMPIDDPRLEKSLEMLRWVKTETEKRGIKLVLAISPRNPDYEQTGAFGSFGPGMSVAKEIIDGLKGDGFFIFDENKFGKHDYPSEMAFDNSHLSYLGAYRFTARLDSVLRTLE